MANTIYSNLFRSISQKSMMTSSQMMKDLEVNHQQARVIAYIAENQDKGLIQKDLAEVFNRRGASITSMLQGLEKKDISKDEFPKRMNVKKISIFCPRD
nr:hypothetical protein [Lactococcus lactis]